ncbi:structural protein [Pectobacterium phage vB_PcaM_CBB]|uniref:Structural protein n=1 Tax=Pectobacterium phage vB_PcaM_CBB TaxID=2772511 RepID=A0A1L2CUU5_9CAUD|nr:structural protein [Pectobacterium phage vB_PcaM_CBB]AMM43795.1 structural protein [Pectobacterium phage vB_PcaM_CBB]
MNNKIEQPRLFVKGHVLITDITDPENVSIVVDKSNAIHPENMSQAIANALAANVDSLGVSLGAISEMRFGNGGTVVLSTGRVTYKTPRISSFGGLYSETYAKKINANVNAGVESEYNNVSTVHIPGQVYTDIVCLCTLGLGEPSDQNVSSTTDMEGNYVFDELGLYTDGTSGIALSHIIFHPVEKSANRILQIKYTVRVQLQ